MALSTISTTNTEIMNSISPKVIMCNGVSDVYVECKGMDRAVGDIEFIISVLVVEIVDRGIRADINQRL